MRSVALMRALVHALVHALRSVLWPARARSPSPSPQLCSHNTRCTCRCDSASFLEILNSFFHIKFARRLHTLIVLRRFNEGLAAFADNAGRIEHALREVSAATGTLKALSQMAMVVLREMGDCLGVEHGFAGGAPRLPLVWELTPLLDASVGRKKRPLAYYMVRVAVVWCCLPPPSLPPSLPRMIAHAAYKKLTERICTRMPPAPPRGSLAGVQLC